MHMKTLNSFSREVSFMFNSNSRSVLLSGNLQSSSWHIEAVVVKVFANCYCWCRFVCDGPLLGPLPIGSLRSCVRRERERKLRQTGFGTWLSSLIFQTSPFSYEFKHSSTGRFHECLECYWNFHVWVSVSMMNYARWLLVSTMYSQSRSNEFTL